MQQRIGSLVRGLAEAEHKRQRAERRAEGNSLSRYLLARLRGEAGEGASEEAAEGDTSAKDAVRTDDAADAGTSAADASAPNAEPSARGADK